MSDMTIVSVKSGLPEYNTGESVNVIITIRNDDLPAVSQIRIYNRVTGKLMQGFGSFLLTNEQFDYTRSIGAMPDDNLKLTITVNGKRKDFEVQLIGAEPVTEEIVEEEKIEEEVDVTPKEKVFKEDIIYRPDIFRIGEVTVSGLPWYVSWLQPLANFFGAISEGVINWFGVVFKPIHDFFDDPIGFMAKTIPSLFSKGSTQSGGTATGLLGSILEGTPDWGTDLKDNLNSLQELFIMPYMNALEPSRYIKYGMSPADAVKNLENLATDLVTADLQLFYTHALMEAGSLGQFEFIQSLDSLVTGKWGLSAITSKLATIPYEKGLLPLVEYHYNSKFPLQIPPYQDLINQVVKEVIPLSTFTAQMLKMGFDAVESRRIWDAHFFAPVLGNLLTSFRRGTITEDRLVELQILVDLDPRYNEIWKDSWYHDPTPRQGRWMFEAGAIDRPRLKNIVERSGLLPDDVEAFTEFQATFQERQWKRRYIIEVARGYRLDKITEDELRKEVLNAYHSVGIAEWIIATEEVAKVIDVKEPKPERVKLLTVADWKKAYILDKIDRDKLNMELLDLNYEQDNINILISTIDEDKIAKTEGAKVVRLTKAEMLQAFKQEEIDEDDLRSYLLDIGLEMLEANILINTKKKQWGLVEE